MHDRRITENLGDSVRQAEVHRQQHVHLVRMRLHPAEQTTPTIRRVPRPSLHKRLSYQGNIHAKKLVVNLDARRLMQNH